MRAAALGLLALAAAGPDDRPPPLPTRDVDVTYVTQAGARTLTQRMRWANAARKLRVDPPTDGLFIVTDYAARRSYAVKAADRSVAEAPAPAPAAASYVRRGEATVAGLSCTEWETRDTDDRATLACITADGVLLRARAGGRTLIIAASVAYAPIDAAIFDIPAGYARAAPQPPTR